MAVCGALCASAVQSADRSAETAIRAQIAAASFEDTIVVDCQLPGRVQQLGAARTYLTSGPLLRLPAIDCRTRGGEYTMGNLASGTLSLKRWLPLADKDNVEAQYYVARIYANGMDGVPVDYELAAKWYQRAAQKKYAPAMQELGYLYEQGLGVPKDPAAGINLQRAASGLGEELVYASTLTANKQQSDAQIALLTDDLMRSSSICRANCCRRTTVCLRTAHSSSRIRADCASCERSSIRPGAMGLPRTWRACSACSNS
jgi:hypothetical protein